MNQMAFNQSKIEKKIDGRNSKQQSNNKKN